MCRHVRRWVLPPSNGRKKGSPAAGSLGRPDGTSRPTDSCKALHPTRQCHHAGWALKIAKRPTPILPDVCGTWELRIWHKCVPKRVRYLLCRALEYSTPPVPRNAGNRGTTSFAPPRNATTRGGSMSSQRVDEETRGIRMLSRLQCMPANI